MGKRANEKQPSVLHQGTENLLSMSSFFQGMFYGLTNYLQKIKKRKREERKDNERISETTLEICMHESRGKNEHRKTTGRACTYLHTTQLSQLKGGREKREKKRRNKEEIWTLI